MTKDLYVKKNSEKTPYRGLLWVAMVIAIVVVFMLIFRMHYPFRQDRVRKSTLPADQQKRSIVVGKVPVIATGKIKSIVRNKITTAAIPEESEPPKPEQPKLQNKSESPAEPPRADLYESRENAKKVQQRKESSLRVLAASEALKEVEGEIRKVEELPTTKDEKKKATHLIPKKTTRKNSMYSLLSPQNAQTPEISKQSQPEKKKAPSDNVVRTSHGVKTRTQNVSYWVQVGAYSKPANANSIRQVLVSKGFPVVIQTINHKKYGKLYLVRVPVRGSKKEAMKYASRIEQQTHEGHPIIIRAK